MLYLDILRLEFEKAIVNLKSTLSNLSKCKVWCKIKIPKFGTKIAYLGIFGQEVENNIAIFEISTLKFF